MEPIIYIFPRQDKIIKINESDLHFDIYPSPKLIKYGFNDVNEKLNMVELTSVPYYRAGLDFDFERTDENSFNKNAQEIFKIKNINYNLDFAEYWEIFVIFGFLKNNQTILTNDKKSIQDLVTCYINKFDSKSNYTIEDLEKQSKSKRMATLLVKKYSNADIDENASIQLVVNDLSNLVKSQAIGANMVLQLFNLQTQTSVEIIYYISSLYNEAYLMKPIVTSDLSDSKYLVLLGLKNIDPDSLNIFSKKKLNTKLYLTSIGLKHLPDDMSTTIQCVNSQIIPKKYKKYNLIKTYLDTKVYEGATYQDMISSQNKLIKMWFDIFTNPDNLKNIMDESLKRGTAKCPTSEELFKLFS